MDATDGGPDFAIVEFGDNTVAIVASRWITNGQCAWPPSTHHLQDLVKSKCTPLPNWKRFSCTTIAWFSSYEAARKKLPLAEDTSDLASEQEQGRGRRNQKKRKLSSSDDSCNESENSTYSLPLPPTPPLCVSSQGPGKRCSTAQGAMCDGSQNGKVSTEHNGRKRGWHDELQSCAVPSSQQATPQTGHYDFSVAGPSSLKTPSVVSHAPTAGLQIEGCQATDVHGKESYITEESALPSQHRGAVLTPDSERKLFRLLHAMKLTLDEYSEQLHLIVSCINDKAIVEEEEYVECPFSDVDKFLSFDEQLGANDKQKLVRTLVLAQTLGGMRCF